MELFNTFLGIYSCLLLGLLGLINKIIELNVPGFWDMTPYIYVNR